MDFGEIAGALTGDPTLTGRTVIWQFALEKISEHPWLGYGFGSFWRVGTGVPSVDEAPGFVAKMPHAHNGYIDILLQIGVVGSVLFTAVILTCIHLVGRITRRHWHLSWFLMTLVLFALLHNLLETTLFEGFSDWCMIMLLAAMIAARSKHTATEINYKL
jgi:O-antigen ligase